jgi:hypothetical protein
MTPTHEQVLAAIDKARAETSCYIDLNCCNGCADRYAHLDDLRATAERHAPVEGSLYGDLCIAEKFETWPCLDYQQIIDRLTRWGVL